MAARAVDYAREDALDAVLKRLQKELAKLAERTIPEPCQEVKQYLELHGMPQVSCISLVNACLQQIKCPGDCTTESYNFNMRKLPRAYSTLLAQLLCLLLGAGKSALQGTLLHG